MVFTPSVRRVDWRHRTYTEHRLEKANPPTQTPYTQPVGWLLNTILIPVLLKANPPLYKAFLLKACLFFNLFRPQPS